MVAKMSTGLTIRAPFRFEAHPVWSGLNRQRKRLQLPTPRVPPGLRPSGYACARNVAIGLRNRDIDLLQARPSGLTEGIPGSTIPRNSRFPSP